MSFYERHGIVRAVQWHRPGDHPHVLPGIREGGGILDIKHAAPWRPGYVEPGDWIVREGDGRHVVVPDAEFRNNYKGV